MPDGHFRSPQPWNGQYSLKKSASKKVLISKKSRAKIPLVMGGTPFGTGMPTYGPYTSKTQQLNITRIQIKIVCGMIGLRPRVIC